MFSKAFVCTVTAALAASNVAFAQTFTACNPMEKTCPPDPALGTSFTCDFTRGKCDAFQPVAGTDVKYEKNGAVFSMSKASDAPTIVSDKYIFFGRVEVKLRCALGSSIVTAATLQSDDLDEIDFEWVGTDDARVQSNYYGKGNTTTYDRGGFHSVYNPSSKSHKYAIEWTKDSIQWFVDDTRVRVLEYRDAKNGLQYPQTPMQIKLGAWSPKEKGAQEWAGGPPDFSKGPFLAHFESVTVVDYAGGDKPAKGGVKEYVWGDKSGSWESIQVVKDKNGQPQHNEEAGTETYSGSASTKTSTSIAEKKTSLSSTASSSNASTTRGGSSSEQPKSSTQSGSRNGSISMTTSHTTPHHPTETMPQSSAVQLLTSLGSTACICLGVVVQILL